MKKIRIFLLTIFAFCLAGLPVFAESVPILPTDVPEASEGYTMLGIEGKYVVQSEEALARINEIRLEACREGVMSPATHEPLTEADYVPIKWSSDLEYIARIRAAESCVTMAHQRTDGGLWYYLRSPSGATSSGEVIAWNWSRGMLQGIEQWYSEKADWVNQTEGAVTGHYTQMIDPRNKYVGLGAFCSNTGPYYNTTVGEYSKTKGQSETAGQGVEKCIQKLEFINSGYPNLLVESPKLLGVWFGGLSKDSKFYRGLVWWATPQLNKY